MEKTQGVNWCHFRADPVKNAEFDIFPFLMASAILVFYDPMVLGCRALVCEGFYVLRLRKEKLVVVVILYQFNRALLVLINICKESREAARVSTALLTEVRFSLNPGIPIILMVYL